MRGRDSHVSPCDCRLPPRAIAFHPSGGWVVWTASDNALEAAGLEALVEQPMRFLLPVFGNMVLTRAEFA